MMTISSVDDYLGAGAQRFFGAGYRRVEYTYGTVSLESFASGAATLRTHLRVAYPADWSRKKDNVDLLPHLSTVDALIIAVQAGDLLLTHTFGLEPEQRLFMRVRQVRIKAAGAPLEELDRLAVRAELLRTEAPGRSSTVEVTIGAMRVRCEIEHPRAAARAAVGDYADPDALLGPAASRYYGTGFVHRAQTIEEIVLDPGTGLARGSVLFPGSAGPGPAQGGIEGGYQPFLGLVESFVTGLQLGQILLYELDGLARGRSNTLWMRGTTMKAAGAAEPLRDGMPITVRLADGALLERPDGIWRTADIVGGIGGTAMRCSIAHRLP
ncbi:AvrD family protein [Kitasatospora sp. NPDC049258]|uniref:AvrD family protein n=1 Tax=Kitasatospora sp. NPDC049258 TaxID=3155394 RepID=UPI003415D2E8